MSFPVATALQNTVISPRFASFGSSCSVHETIFFSTFHTSKPSSTIQHLPFSSICIQYLHICNVHAPHTPLPVNARFRDLYGFTDPIAHRLSQSTFDISSLIAIPDLKSCICDHKASSRLPLHQPFCCRGVISARNKQPHPLEIAANIPPADIYIHTYTHSSHIARY